MIKSIATHDGPFHTDEVFAVAVLRRLYPKAKIVRTREKGILDDCDIVVDVGGEYSHELRRYDHHQQGRAGADEYGVLYSSLGLVWKHYGKEWSNEQEEVYVYIADRLVRPIDAIDNGMELTTLSIPNVQPFSLQDIIRLYRPLVGEEQDFDAGFIRALDFADFILYRLQTKAELELKNKEVVKSQLKDSPDKRYVVQDEYVPLGDVVEDYPDLLFHVYPNTGGLWCISTVKKQKGSFENRQDLPKVWAGLQGEEFERITGISGVDFCHNALFLAGCKTKEACLSLLDLALSATK